MKSSQVAFAAFCYPREGEGHGVPQRKGGYGGEGRGICICPSPGQTTILERREQKQERRSRRGPRDSLNLSCPTKGDNKSVHIEILL